MKRWKRSVGILALILFMTACAAEAPSTPLETEMKAPDRLDLSGTGLTDIGALLDYTWLTELDLRGNEISVTDYEALSAALPNCRILWSVPIGGERFDSTATALTLENFSAADADALAYFEALRSVEVRHPADYALLREAAAHYTGMEILWSVTLGDHTVSSNTTSLRLTDETMDAAAIRAVIDALPKLEYLDLRSLPLSDGDKLALHEAYPAIRFGWIVTLLDGLTVDSDMETLDLRGYTVKDVDALIAKLRLLPALTSLDMCDCGPSDEEMLRIREALPGVKVIWMIDVAFYRIRTDIQGFSTGVQNRFPNDGGKRVRPHNYKSVRNGAFDKLVYCTDIVALDFGHCVNLTDMSFVANMPKLRYLVLSGTGVTDISPLATQTELIFLEFWVTKVTDISPLANCRKIRYLCFSGSPVANMEPILDMEDLERLFITATALTDEQLQRLVDAFPNADLNISRDLVARQSEWRKGNWGYVEMQRIFGMPAQYQADVTPTPEPMPTPAP